MTQKDGPVTEDGLLTLAFSPAEGELLALAAAGVEGLAEALAAARAKKGGGHLRLPEEVWEEVAGLLTRLAMSEEDTFRQRKMDLLIETIEDLLLLDDEEE